MQINIEGFKPFNSSHKKMLKKIKVLFILWKTWHVAQKCSNKKIYKF